MPPRRASRASARLTHGLTSDDNAFKPTDVASAPRSILSSLSVPIEREIRLLGFTTLSLSLSLSLCPSYLSFISRQTDRIMVSYTVLHDSYTTQCCLSVCLAAASLSYLILSFGERDQRLERLSILSFGEIDISYLSILSYLSIFRRWAITGHRFFRRRRHSGDGHAPR